MDDIIKEGQIITTASGARGLITKASDYITIKWIINDSGEPISEPPAAYPLKDITHSLESGFLTLSASNDPNLMFSMRKSNANS